MRILYISHSNTLAGSSIALYNMVKGITELGHEVCVVTTKEDGFLLQKLDEIGCPYFRLDLTLDIYPQNKNLLGYLPRLILRIWRHYHGVKKIVEIIQKFHPDIVHTNVGPYSVGYDACQKTGVKHVWHQREYQDKDFDMHYFPCISSFMKKTHSRNNFNICITKGIFDYRNFRKDKDIVIYDGVFSESQIPFLPQRDEKNFLLFVGRIEDGKGLYDILEAYQQFHLKYPSMRLIVIGEFSDYHIQYEKKCKEYIREHDLTDDISFLGHKDNVFEYMAQAKMLIVPSRFEGFGFITVEAMLNGCPVVGRDTGGTKEQFDNGLSLMKSEIALRFNNQKELLSAMEYIMEHDMTEICKKAKSTVLQLYSLQQNVKQVENFYQRVIRNN